MDRAAEEIKQMVDLETKAWETQDVDLLLSLFHPDMVWYWPKDNTSHDPVDWEAPLGKFNADRWEKFYRAMFAKNRLVRNDRKIVEIKVTAEGDGALAVVDVDTVWEDRDGNQMHWLGRAAKTYTKIGDEWKLIAHYGLLLY